MTEPNPSAPTPPSGNKKLLTAAHILSGILSPLLVPTIGMIITMTLTGMVILPASTRAGATLGVFFITCMLPMFLIFILMKAG